MDVIHERAHAAGEKLGVETQIAVLAASVPISVVDVYEFVTGLVEPSGHHSVGLTLDNLLVDVKRERVPRAPAHRGRIESPDGMSDHHGDSQENKCPAFHF